MASAPVAARGPGRAGVGALVDDLDGAPPLGANAPANMRPAFEQLVPVLRDDAKVSGSQFGVRGDVPISVSPDAVGGAPDGMVLGGAQFSAEGDLVVPLLNVAPNASVNGRPAVPAVLASFGRLEVIPKLAALRSVEIPPVAGIGTFIRDRRAAVALGKAFFWDANVGSDGNACASCHFAAGADNRLKNQLSPGLLAGDSAFSRHLPSAQRRAEMRAAAADPAATGPKSFRGMSTSGGGVNYTLRPADFPFYRLADPLDRNSAVVFETNDVVSSQGTFSGAFGGSSGASEQCGNRAVDEYSVHGALTRRVAPRNSPTVINAVFNHRNFWDGRANNVFNGVNPFGDRDERARVLERKPDGSVKPVRVALPNASLASQAVGPALSEFEMSCSGRTFMDLGRKLLPLRPLARQHVDAQDSVLGPMSARGGRGLATTYAAMVRQAFHEDWWAGEGAFDGYSQMERNFSLFWGLAIMAYEATLVSDEAPVDRFVGWAGTPPDASALRQDEIRGLEIFRGKALCVSCHRGAEFTGAATGLQPHRESNLTEQMFVGKGQIGLYDNGYYNIGVRPTIEDLGVGGRDPFGRPLSFSRQYLDLLSGKPVPDAFFVRTCLFAVRTDAKECWTPPDPGRTRVGVDGAFKTPSLRNVALTRPYFHNGSRFTLEQVVEFYNRGGDRRGPDGNDTTGYGAPDAPGSGPSNTHPNIRPLGLTQTEQTDLVAFLRYALTDRRVACRQAPFDHPSLELPNGHAGNERRVRAKDGRAVDDFISLAAVGAAGVPEAECYRNDNGTRLDSREVPVRRPATPPVTVPVVPQVPVAPPEVTASAAPVSSANVSSAPPAVAEPAPVAPAPPGVSAAAQAAPPIAATPPVAAPAPSANVSSAPPAVAEPAPVALAPPGVSAAAQAALPIAATPPVAAPNVAPEVAASAAPASLGTVSPSQSAFAIIGAGGLISGSPAAASRPSAATGGIGAGATPAAADPFAMPGFRSFGFTDAAGASAPIPEPQIVSPPVRPAASPPTAAPVQEARVAQAVPAAASPSAYARLREADRAFEGQTPAESAPNLDPARVADEGRRVRDAAARPVTVDVRTPGAPAAASAVPKASPERKADPAAEPRAVELLAWSPALPPKLEFDNIDGTRFDASVFRGRRVVLNFWAVWCVPCREEIPALQRMADAMQGQGVQVVLVNVGDSREAIARFLQRVPTRLPIVRVRGDDSPRAGDWNVTALPTTVLVDPSGTPRWRAVGRVDGKASEVLLVRRLSELGRPR